MRTMSNMHLTFLVVDTYDQAAVSKRQRPRSWIKLTKVPHSGSEVLGCRVARACSSLPKASVKYHSQIFFIERWSLRSDGDKYGKCWAGINFCAAMKASGVPYISVRRASRVRRGGMVCGEREVKLRARSGGRRVLDAPLNGSRIWTGAPDRPIAPREMLGVDQRSRCVQALCSSERMWCKIVVGLKICV